ncbi:MAG: glycoside hydrolase [Anaerolineales bacterium]|nr:glycoside hydrolase [Anaerolineales bacterium]
MWQTRLAHETTWRPLPVPSAWEEHGIPPTFPGPVWYRTTLPVPPRTPEQRVWLRFHAVSYHCQVTVNGNPVGEHTGAWDSFSLEITAPINAFPGPHGDAEILVRVTKPISLTAGPDSPPLPGEHPLRETLAGFLPYVWGHAFGGLWQPVESYLTGHTYIKSASLRGDAQGRLFLQATLSHPAPLHLQILTPAGDVLFTTTLPPAITIDHSHFLIDQFSPWSPASPTLYTARLTVENGDEKILRFGFRTLTTQENTLLLNERPLYPRFILSWGWYPDRRCPDPGPARIRADFIRLKALGYNGVKLCLWFPPQYVFDLADELGMLLWVEFPLWLPQVTPFFCTQTPLEIERLTHLARHHPSVILYTLGCELGPEVDAGFLHALTQTVKTLIGDALLAGNSGSGEAYGGPLDSPADFYDHHFYADPPFLASLYDTFAPQWRKPKPWLMGEFNDFDTLRNWPQFHLPPGDAARHSFWWLTNTPQGARWAMEVYEQEARLKALQLWDQAHELYQLSLQKAYLHRKQTVETVRARPALSGYVITGEVDTPISTAGMWDDVGAAKFAPEDFRRFNGDTVLLLGFRRWRAWVAGGDRPVFGDRFCYWGGEVVRVALLVSHFGVEQGGAHTRWEVGFEGDAPFASGEILGACVPGQVQEVGTVQFLGPEVDRPRSCVLRVATEMKGENGGNVGLGENEWGIWFFPREVWQGVVPFVLDDPAGRLADLLTAEARVCSGRWAERAVGVFTQWTLEAARFVAQGGRAILMQGAEPGLVPTVARPFWRECIQIGEPHPAWGRFPAKFGMQYYALGTDRALVVPPGRGFPLLRRLDTRQMEMEAYAVVWEVGQGQVLVTTLRLDGGLGDQPSGITRSPAGMFLLAEWVRYLQA